MEQKSTGTYKISFKKIARAAATEVRVHKKLSIITIVLYGVAMLLFIFDADIHALRDVDNNLLMGFNPSGWGIFFAVIGVIVGYFTVLNVFRDMNNQQLCDVSMALPIKASERFLSKVLSLFYIQIFPLIISTFVGNGIAVLWGTAHFGSIDPDAAKNMFMIVLGCLAGSMFIMAIAVLCACCCGALAESAYFSIMLMFVLNILPIFFVYYIIPICAGFSSWSYSNQNIDLGYFGLLFFISDDKIIPHCLVSSAISLVIMLLSGLIYIKRDARSVGKPISSKLFFEIIMALGCVTVFAVFAMSDYVFWGILISLVGYVIINIIVSRAKINVFSFLKWGGKYAATLAAFTVLLIVTIKTGGFGYINARPAAEYLDGATFEIIYFDYTYESVNYVYRRENLETAVLTAEQADEVMSICKKYFAESRAKINPFDIIFGESYNVIVTAKSDKRYSYCPSPKNHFTYWYNDRQGYSLSYRQRLYLPDSDAKAMIEELYARGFVNTVTRDPEIIAPETQVQ